jgi:large subunit ribosomal protein L10
MPTPEKEADVQELAGLFRDAEGIYLTDFTGLDVETLGILRRRCRQNAVKYRVIKNRLAKRAVAGTEAESVIPYLVGPTAIAVTTGNAAIPARVLKQFFDEFERPSVKAGLVGGRLLDAAEVWRIAGLPPREVLLAQFLGGLQSPLRNVMWGMKSVAQGLVRALAAIQEQKQAAESAGS